MCFFLTSPFIRNDKRNVQGDGDFVLGHLCFSPSSGCRIQVLPSEKLHEFPAGKQLRSDLGVLLGAINFSNYFKRYSCKNSTVA